jgi:hypothetical protein
MTYSFVSVQKSVSLIFLIYRGPITASATFGLSNGGLIPQVPCDTSSPGCLT